MEIADSARKRGVADADILHAWTRLLILGPGRDGALLELVVVEADRPNRVIHADRMRPKFLEYLR